VKNYLQQKQIKMLSALATVQIQTEWKFSGRKLSIL